MTDVSAEDIAAMRRDGSFGEFLRHLGSKPQPAAAPPAKAKALEPRDPNHRPGAWPTGTRPPGPVEPQDPAAWQQAVEDYRHGNYDAPANCECSGCRIAAKSLWRMP
jgi:hypothetical protein